MKRKSFSALNEVYEGLVFLGCYNPAEWNKVIELLEKEKLAKKKDFEESFYITTTGGRNDVVLPFKRKNKIEIGKLAMWRLKFGDCSWVSDYLVNYRDQHIL